MRVGARSGVGPEFEKGDGRLRPSLEQRLPGAEGPRRELGVQSVAAHPGPGATQ